jgi:hypothetical protein
MNNTPIQEADSTVSTQEKKPGFFGRLFQKLDSSMKQKAEEKSKQGSCCGGKDRKGGKCC